MKNGVRFVVTTHWGTFSLDEGSYQDYLNGKHWICWAPGKPEREQNSAGQIPANITDRAVSLREQADRNGILPTIRKLNIPKVIVPYSSRLAELSIDEMNLTVRSRNGLRRANIHTFGDLRQRMETEGGLSNIRNMISQSTRVILQNFLMRKLLCLVERCRKAWNTRIKFFSLNCGCCMIATNGN